MFVVASSEAAARDAIRVHIASRRLKDPRGWGYDYCNGNLGAFELTIAAPLNVIENDNS